MLGALDYLLAFVGSLATTCKAVLVATQVAHCGSGTSNHTAIGELLSHRFNLRRTLDWQCQFLPNQCRASAITEYHCWSVDTNTQKRCRSRAVVLSGSRDVDIELEISVLIQKINLAFHRTILVKANTTAEVLPAHDSVVLLLDTTALFQQRDDATTLGIMQSLNQPWNLRPLDYQPNHSPSLHCTY